MNYTDLTTTAHRKIAITDRTHYPLSQFVIQMADTVNSFGAVLWWSFWSFCLGDSLARRHEKFEKLPNILMILN